MKIVLRTFGGLAAGIKRPARELDSESLPSPLAEEAARLIHAVRLGPRKSGSPPGQVRDGMSYEITVTDAGKTEAFKASDGALSASFAALLEWLESHCQS